MLIWIVGFALIAAIGSILAASAILLFPIEKRKKVLPWLISYATGTLLGASFLGLLPEAMETLSNAETLGATLAGIILFLFSKSLSSGATATMTTAKPTTRPAF